MLRKNNLILVTAHSATTPYVEATGRHIAAHVLLYAMGKSFLLLERVIARLLNMWNTTPTPKYRRSPLKKACIMALSQRIQNLPMFCSLLPRRRIRANRRYEPPRPRAIVRLCTILFAAAMDRHTAVLVWPYASDSTCFLLEIVLITLSNILASLLVANDHLQQTVPRITRIAANCPSNRMLQSVVHLLHP